MMYRLLMRDMDKRATIYIYVSNNEKMNKLLTKCNMTETKHDIVDIYYKDKIYNTITTIEDLVIEQCKIKDYGQRYSLLTAIISHCKELLIIFNIYNCKEVYSTAVKELLHIVKDMRKKVNRHIYEHKHDL